MKKIILFISLFVVTMSGWTQSGNVIGWGESWQGIIDQPVRSISSGFQHSFILKEDGTLASIGYLKLNDVGKYKNVKKITSGELESLVLFEDSTILCETQLSIPYKNEKFLDIASGAYFSLGIKKDSTIVAWGSDITNGNGWGQCNIPTGLKSVKSVKGGGAHSLALKSDGTVLAWGYNSFGQCDVPQNLKKVIAIEAGDEISIALQEDSTVVVWGKDIGGQTNVPHDLKGVIEVKGYSDHVIALKKDGTVISWGALDTNTTYTNFIKDLKDVKSIDCGGIIENYIKKDGSILTIDRSSGKFHVYKNSDQLINRPIKKLLTDNQVSIALTFDNEVIVWGANLYDITDVPKDLVNVKDILYKDGVAIALKNNGTIVVWGKNDYGLCNVPTDLKKVKEIEILNSTIVALQDDGTVVSWGKNKSVTPIFLTDIMTIEIGDYFGLGLKEDGTVVSWGTLTNVELSVPISLKKVKQIGIIDNLNAKCLIALQTDGKVVIWGNDPNGIFAVPAGLSNVSRIITGPDNIVAIKEDGTSIIWGDNSFGLCGTFPELKNAVEFFVFRNNIGVIKENGTLAILGDTSIGQLNFPKNLKNIFTLGSSDSHLFALVRELTHKNSNSISGFVFDDKNSPNCLKENEEKGVKYSFVKATPGNFYATTDTTGKYKLYVDTGKVDYTITQILNPIEQKLTTNNCTTSYIAKLSGSQKDTAGFDFANQIKYCSLLDVEVANENRRRCFRSSTSVYYCNAGNADAANALVKVSYPEYLIPISSVPTWTKREGNVLYYELGDLAVNKCGKINIIDSVQCGIEGIRGLTLCVKAEISPVSSCRTPSANYDGSRVDIESNCDNGIAKFFIINNTENNMNNPSEFFVYVNDTLIGKKDFQLEAKSKIPIEYPAFGKTIRLVATQVPNFPDNSNPTAIIEGCVVDYSKLPEAFRDLVLSAPQDDAEAEKAVSCSVIRGSFDPNDKQAQPVGLTAKHYIKAGTTINYTIRFQNTGTDNAYKVVVVDTLDSNLNLATLKVGSASHAYTLEVSGKGKAVLTFMFNAINLPTKTANEKASEGYISFSLATLSTLVDETIINNKAGIYFDFNDPVITNNVTHTIGEPVLENFALGTDLVEKPAQPLAISASVAAVGISVFPNPTEGVLYINGVEASDEIRFLDLTGREELKVKTSAESISVESLSKGFHLYEIRRHDEILKQGKVIVK